MDIEAAARGFAAMGSEARLNVLNAVIRAGADGLTVGDIQARTGIAPSTTVNRAAFDHLEGLADFILRECCADVQPRAANNG